MTHNNPPIACSLDGGKLEQRLAAIGEAGGHSLVSHSVKDGSHLLRFRTDPTTRQRLEDIVAGEAECCPFLDLSLSEEGDELILSITAPEDGRAVASELAGAFGGGSERKG
jgi:hypothetical protein